MRRNGKEEMEGEDESGRGMGGGGYFVRVYLNRIWKE